MKSNNDRILVMAAGKDQPGFVAAVTSIISDLSGNIEEMDQVVLSGIFVMSLIIKLEVGAPHFFAKVERFLIDRGAKIGLRIYVNRLKDL